MTTKILPSGYEMLTVLMVLSVAVSGLAINGTLFVENDATNGQIIPLASASEPETLEKEVGQTVHFKVKVKNTGTVEAVYIVVAMWREHGTEEWEPNCIEDVWLSPSDYELIMLDGILCTEEMVDKYFDVKFVLYDSEENVLDDKTIENAWYVKEKVIQGVIYEFWIE